MGNVGIKSTVESTVNVSNRLAISDHKIFVIRNAEDCMEFREEVLIVHFESENSERIQKIISFLNFKNFPNALAVTANLNFDVHSLSNLIDKSREFFVHIKIDDDFQAFHKPKNSENFKIIQGCKEKSFETFEQFFGILNYLKTLLHKVDLNEILNFLNFDLKNDKFLHLYKAIETKNESMVKLLALFVNTFDENLLEYAKATENDEIIHIINNSLEEYTKDLKISCKFCNNFAYDIPQEEVQTQKFQLSNRKSYKRSNANLEKFYESIRNGDLLTVQELCENNQHLKSCYGVSVLEEAIIFNEFEIYSYLLSEGFHSENQDSLDERIKNLSIDQKKQIQNFNLKFLRKSPKKSINIVASKCKFFINATLLSYTTISEMLEKAMQVEGVEEMMKILAQCDVTIATDLNNRLTYRMSPSDEGLLGKADVSNRVIYIAGADCKEEQKNIFVHEMTHYVCNTIYENGFLPYCKFDKVREVEFDGIFNEVKRTYNNNKSDVDPILSHIFTLYTDSTTKTQKSELIARVPHMLAAYQNDDKNLEKIYDNFTTLIEFYETKFINDLRIKNAYRMIKLNNSFGILKRIEESNYQVESASDLNVNLDKILLVSKIPQLVLSKIVSKLKEILVMENSAVKFKAENIFVDVEKLAESLGDELKKIMKSQSAKRIIVDVTNLKAEHLKFYLSQVKRVQCVFVSSEENFDAINILTDEFKFVRQEINFGLKDLSIKTQELLLKKKVTFQGQDTTIELLLNDPLNSITPEILSILCQDREIHINSELSGKNWKNFILRKIETKKPNSSEKMELSTKDFILNTRNEENFQNLVLISDPAGSGKTFLFRKLCDKLKTSEILQDVNFVIFIALKSHIEDLKIGVGESLVHFIAKIKKFDALTTAIFEQKYKMGETIIFLDAFDEISPHCKENTKKIFKLFEKNGKNQLFVSTRIHLEFELENEMKVRACKLKIFKEEDQIQFLTKYWRGSTDNQDFIKKCAENLVKKISQIIRSSYSLIGVPIILCGLAEYFKKKIDDKFETEVENLNISGIYKKIVIDKPYDVFAKKYREKVDENLKKNKSPNAIHQFYAVQYLLDTKIANSLGLFEQTDWDLEEIARYGIISYKEKHVNFGHETNAEFLVALFLFNLMESAEHLAEDQKKFMIRVLTESKFKLSRLFLDSMLEKVESYEKNMKLFNSGEHICEFIFVPKITKEIEEEDGSGWTLVDESCSEEFFHIFEFFMSSVFKVNKKIFRGIIQVYSFDRKKVLARAKNANKIGQFLDKIQETISFDSFMEITKIFHIIAETSKSERIFEIFWSKSEDYIKDRKKLRKIFIRKGRKGQNVLTFALRNENDLKIFQHIFDIAWTKVFDKNKDDFEKFLFERDVDADENVITYAAMRNCTENFKFLCDKIEVIFGTEKLREILKMKGHRGKNLLFSAASLNLPTAIEVFWKIYEKYFNIDEIREILEQTDNFGNNFLHEVAEFSFSFQNFEFWIPKIKESLGVKSLQNLLLMKNAYGRNILIVTAFLNSEIFPFVFEYVFGENFTSFHDFIHEIDENGDNFLQKLIIYGNVTSLKFTFKKLKEKLENFEDFLLKRKENGQNCFHLVDHYSDRMYSAKLRYLINFVRKKFGNEKLQELLIERDDKNSCPLHKTLVGHRIKKSPHFISIYEENFNDSQIEEIINLKERQFYEDILMKSKTDESLEEIVEETIKFIGKYKLK